MKYPRITDPESPELNRDMLQPPIEADQARRVELVKGPNIASLPQFDPLPDQMELPILLKVADNISTDEIMPAGSRILPYRSNIPKISEFVFEAVDETYYQRATETRDSGGHAIVGGHNYGQGSSREHAALAPRFLGLRVVIAKSFARIHWQNLVSFGVLPLTLCDEADFERLARDDRIKIEGLRKQVGEADSIVVYCGSNGDNIETRHNLSPRQRDVLLAGGLINWVKSK